MLRLLTIVFSIGLMTGSDPAMAQVPNAAARPARPAPPTQPRPTETSSSARHTTPHLISNGCSSPLESFFLIALRCLADGLVFFEVVPAALWRATGLSRLIFATTKYQPLRIYSSMVPAFSWGMT